MNKSFNVLIASFLLISLTACGENKVDKKQEQSSNAVASAVTTSNTIESNSKSSSIRETKEQQHLAETLIDNGPSLYVNADMGFEELSRALCMFRMRCRCEEIRNKYTDFFEHSNFSMRDGLYIPPAGNANELSYKEKKRILLKNHKDVVNYIEGVYITPIAQLEGKYLSKVDRSRINYRYGLPCEWHTTVLAQRGTAFAQLLLGCRILDTKRYEYTEHVGGFQTGPGAWKKRFNEELFQQDLKWLVLAGEAGEKAAYHILGTASKNAGSLEAAVDWFRKGADEGDPSCMFEIGEIARTQVKDYQVALGWYEKAAELGHYMATKYCAELLSINTRNTKPDYIRSISYYQKLIEMEQRDQGLYYENRINSYENKIKTIKLKMDE